MFVRYSCGCVGFRPKVVRNKGKVSIIIEGCDPSPYDDQYGFFFRDMKGKTFVNVEDWEIGYLVGEISNLISDGYKLQTIKNLLKDNKDP